MEMNACAELMAKIVKLAGWEWEWGFWDRAWYDGCEWIVDVTRRSPAIGCELYLSRPVGCSVAISKSYAIPLLTVEQWDKKFYKAGYNLHIERRGTTFIVAVVNHDTHEQHENNCHESILMRSIAELFARVVLGYRYVDGEFVK